MISYCSNISIFSIKLNIFIIINIFNYYIYNYYFYYYCTFIYIYYLYTYITCVDQPVQLQLFTLCIILILYFRLTFSLLSLGP